MFEQKARKLCAIEPNRHQWFRYCLLYNKKAAPNGAAFTVKAV